ncbi:Retrovirus-related Pol polyprotein from transposon 17.6, partial [Mucuna pruriens]
MCDASNLALGTVLGQQVGKHSHVIAYASCTLDSTQANYTTIENELLDIVFALDKFRFYLLDSKIVVFSDHATLKLLLKKSDVELRLIRWMLLLQEFDIEIRDKSREPNIIGRTRQLGRFGMSKALISDQGSYFYNKIMSTLLEKYGVVHRVSTIIPKPMGRSRIAYQTPLGMFPYQIDFGKACHLPIEIEHHAYWATKRCNLAFDQAGKERKLQSQALDKLCFEAYENSKIYKEKVKRFHDNMVLRKELKVGKKVNEATDKTFKVNGHQLKLFHVCPTMMEGDVEDLSLVKPTFLEVQIIAPRKSFTPFSFMIFLILLEVQNSNLIDNLKSTSYDPEFMLIRDYDYDRNMYLYNHQFLNIDMANGSNGYHLNRNRQASISDVKLNLLAGKAAQDMAFFSVYGVGGRDYYPMARTVRAHAMEATEAADGKLSEVHEVT